MNETQPASFGDALKAWRTRRHLSQLDLALEANVSTRHISFLETGRAQPSREMVMQLASSLNLPLRARNELLEHAGYARAFRESRLEAEALKPVRAALDHMLASHAPYPALICDRHWTLVDANAAARQLLSPLQDQSGERNLVRMVATSPAARQQILNWDEVMRDFSGRLRLEVRRSGGDEVLSGLLSLINDSIGALLDEPASGRPFIPVRLALPQGELSLMSMLAEFGTPRDITISDLRIELFFPADDAAAAFFKRG